MLARNFSFVFLTAAIFLSLSWVASGATMDELRTRIEEGNRKIDELTTEIDRLSGEINKTAKQSQTLQNALKQLELTKKKLAADLALTSQKIESTADSIDELSQDIKVTEHDINVSIDIISESLRLINMAESQSALEEFLKNKTISDAWDYVNTLSKVQDDMRIRLINLKDEKSDLTEKQSKMEIQKKSMLNYEKTLPVQ